jgi:hypothetical protein
LVLDGDTLTFDVEKIQEILSRLIKTKEDAVNIAKNYGWLASSGGGAVGIFSQGNRVIKSVNDIHFTGNGVTVTRHGKDIKIDIPGGGGGEGGGITTTQINTFTALQIFNAGISAAGTTLSNARIIGNLSVTNGITLNSAGTATPLTYINVERGISADVGLRWNESTDRWQFSNDGANWSNIIANSITVNPIPIRDTDIVNSPLTTLASENNQSAIQINAFYNSAINPTRPPISDTMINGDRWYNNTSNKLYTWITQLDDDAGLTGFWAEM